MSDWTCSREIFCMTVSWRAPTGFDELITRRQKNSSHPRQPSSVRCSAVPLSIDQGADHAAEKECSAD